MDKGLRSLAQVEYGPNGSNLGGSLVLPNKDAAALEVALEHVGVEYRYDLRSGRVQFRRALHAVDFPEVEVARWQNSDDRKVAQIRRKIAETCRYKLARGDSTAQLHFGRESWDLCLNSLLYHRQVDAFVDDFLAKLPAWDGKRRLENLLAECFDIEPQSMELAKWAGKFLCLGSVWRTMQPGTKLDEMPVLVGPRGIGKSTIARMMLPNDHPEWFSDSLDLAAPPRERAESLLGRVIVEISEMAGATRAKNDSLKAFLSRTDDGSHRLAYRRDPETLLRRSVFIGTADRQDCLPNDHNLRRFVPVFLAGGDIKHLREYMVENREQLWAEARVEYSLSTGSDSLRKEILRQLKDRGIDHSGGGTHPRLPASLVQVQDGATARARSCDVIIEDALASTEHRLAAEGKTLSGRTMQQIADELGIGGETQTLLSKQDQSRLGRTLRNRGYERVQRKVGGRPVKAWEKV